MVLVKNALSVNRTFLDFISDEGIIGERGKFARKDSQRSLRGYKER